MNPAAADWANFFVSEVGAAAALAGLVAVAISINLKRILEFPQLPARAAETLFLLTGIFVLASLGLVPGQTAAVFGAEIVFVAAATLIVSARAQIDAWRDASARPLHERIMRALTVAVALAPLIVGGAELLFGATGGLYWVAAGIIISLASGVWNAWILLVEILR